MLRMLILCGALALAAPAGAQPSQPAQDRSNARVLTSAASYLPVPTLSSSVMGRYGAGGVLVVDCGLDVPNTTLRARANAAGPRLRDALRTALAAYTNTYYRPNTAPDPDALTRVMQASVDRTLGAPGARVLLSNVVYQGR